MESQEVTKIIKEFQRYLNTEEGKSHLSYLKDKEPKETKEVLEKLKTLPKNSPEFVDLVLYGLLPYGNTKYAKRVSIAPAFLNIRKFFARFNYTEDDWKELSNLIYELIVKFQENPDSLEELIRDFISNRLSKGIQCGSLSPIFCALNSDFPMVNNRVIRSYRRLSFLVLGQMDKLNQRLENYLSSVEKIKKFARILSIRYDFKKITDMRILDFFCYWYDEYHKAPKKLKKAALEKAIPPLEQRYITKFLQVLACSPPQPFLVETLKNLDGEHKIIYNTEFQRGEVWNTRRKQKLIDSILRGYSINTIFLRQLSDGKYECLDGQQRLKTLLKRAGEKKGFLYDGFPINPDITAEFKRKTYFEELPEPLKSKIRSYIIYAIIIYTHDDEETCKIFLRLQEGLSLNSAEKLNAMIGFLRNEIVGLAKHQFMKKLGINDYRFAHRYMIAQAYLLTSRNRITDVKFRNLQEIYRSYKSVRPPQTVANTIERVLNFLGKEFEEDAHVIRKRADFASLFLLSRHFLDNYVTSEKVGLSDYFITFSKNVDKVVSSEEEENVPYFDYKTYRKTSADSRDSIEKRFDIILTKFLEFNQKLVPKDPKRSFDYWEKLAVHRRDAGVCQLCGKRTPFDKGTVDHITPHSKGGLTIIENGQWSCFSCNIEKSDKTKVSTPYTLEKEIHTLSNDVFSLMSDCNNICSSKSKKEIFKITNRMFRRIADVGKPVKTGDEFGNLIDALYEIIYEGSGSLNRIPESFKKSDFIGFVIKFLRADLRHDLEHGKEKEIKKKKARLAKIYGRYTGKTSLSSLENKDFSKIQVDILRELKSFLTILKQSC